MKRQTICLFALVGAVFITSCSHILYVGIPTGVEKPQETKKPLNTEDTGSPALKAPSVVVQEWVPSKDSKDRPSDGYFSITAIPDQNITDPTVARIGSSNYWSSEQASYTVTVEPKNFNYWTKGILYPVFTKSTTPDQKNTYIGSRKYVPILPWYPIDLLKGEEMLVFSYKGESSQTLELSTYVTAATSVAGLFAGGGVVSAFAARTATQTAMNTIQDVYKDIVGNMQKIEDTLDIEKKHIQSGNYYYELPMYYFRKGETDDKIKKARANRNDSSILFRIYFIVRYTRSVVGVGYDGPENGKEIPHAYLDLALDYLTYPWKFQTEPETEPQTKSLLERIAMPYPGILEELKGPNTAEACDKARKFIKAAGYSSSDQGALYGALLYVASGRNKNFLYDPKFYNPACFPLNDFGKLVLTVYPELYPPSPPWTEFTSRGFGEPDKSIYSAILSDVSLGMSFNRRDRAAGYIGPRLMKMVNFTSAGNFAGPNGSKTADEAIDELSKLNISQVGCFMPAEHIARGPRDPRGPRLIILSSKPDRKPIVGMITFTLDNELKAVSGVDIRNIDSAVVDYIEGKDTAGTPNFAATSKCADIVRNIRNDSVTMLEI